MILIILKKKKKKNKNFFKINFDSNFKVFNIKLDYDFDRFP